MISIIRKVFGFSIILLALSMFIQGIDGLKYAVLFCGVIYFGVKIGEDIK